MVDLSALLPWRSFTIETSWAPEVAAAELAKEIAGPMLPGGGYAPFVGRGTSPYDFEFSRRIEYRNSFLPVVRTTVEASHRGGALVRVTMRMNPFVIAFTSLWMSGATLGGLGGLIGLLNGHPAGSSGWHSRFSGPRSSASGSESKRTRRKRSCARSTLPLRACRQRQRRAKPIGDGSVRHS